MKFYPTAVHLLLSVFFVSTCSASLRAFLVRQSTSKKFSLYGSDGGPSEKAGTPLLLTPLIEANNISEALERSQVPPLLPGIKSNAGYLTVNKTAGAHLYFWFFRKTGKGWEKAPLILWLQGGPGCSSLFGTFTENGPFFVTKEGRLRRQQFAWTKKYNMLYIDQPVGTGFSFTDDDGGYISTQQQVADHLYEALTQFYKLFPQLKANPFFVAGESYAGKYIPALGYKIYKANLNSSLRIPLKGMLIGNGYSDPENQMEYADYLHGLGLIDYTSKEKLNLVQERIKRFIRSSRWQDAKKLTDSLLDEVSNITKFKYLYDYTHENSQGDSYYVEFIEQDDIRKKLHVGQTKYEDCSDTVYEYFETDMLQSVKPWIEELLEHYPVVLYSGQYDIIVAYPLSENFLLKLQWSGAREYLISNREIWRDGQYVVGYIKKAGNLMDVMIRGAGHMVPVNQPKYAFKLVSMVIDGTLDKVTHQ